MVEEASSLGGYGPGHLHSVDQGSIVVTQHGLRVDSEGSDIFQKGFVVSLRLPVE